MSFASTLVGYTIGGRSVQLESTLVVKDDGDGQSSPLLRLWNHHELLPVKPGASTLEWVGELSAYEDAVVKRCRRL